FPEAIDHRRHVHRLHDRLTKAADLAQVPHEKRVSVSVVTKLPCSSARPARSASPSTARPTFACSAGMRRRNSSMFGGIGSGFTPPNHGLRSAWSSTPFVLPPPMSFGKYPLALPNR